MRAIKNELERQWMESVPDNRIRQDVKLAFIRPHDTK